MDDRFALTMYFKQLFPDLDTFETIAAEYSNIDLTDTTNQTFAAYLYDILFKRFHNSNTAAETPEDFYASFFLTFDDIFKKYQEQLDLIDKVYALTDDDILVISEVLTNASSNPNTVPTDPWEMINYVSAQTRGRNKTNKLVAYMQAIRELPARHTAEILRDFGTMFIEFGTVYKGYIPGPDNKFTFNPPDAEEG